MAKDFPLLTDDDYWKIKAFSDGPFFHPSLSFCLLTAQSLLWDILVSSETRFILLFFFCPKA